jgi:hypothetical protein
MNSWHKAGAAAAILATSGCAVVSPVIDRDMSGAPNLACISVNAQAIEGAPRCFVLAEELPDGSRRAWSGGSLEPGRVLIAIHQPGGQCAGTFSHLTVTGASPGAAQAEIATWDGLGRMGHARTLHWDRAFTARTFAMSSIESTTMNPAGARVRVTQGSFDPASLCFKSY